MDTGFIDWTEKSLNLYIFKKDGRDYHIREKLSFDLDNGLTRELLDSLPSGGLDNIDLSVPVSFLTMREQSFPFSDKEKIKETLTYELEGMLLDSPESYSIDHIDIGAHNGVSRVLAVCMEKTKLSDALDLLSSAGIDPRIVTSIDLRLSGGIVEKLFDEPEPDTHKRAEAAAMEISEPSINLRQGDLSYTGDIEKFAHSFRITALLVLALFIVMGVNNWLNLSHLEKEHNRLSDEIRTIYQSVFPEDKRIVDIERQFRGNINALEKKNEILAGIPVLDMLLDIAENRAMNNIRLNEFSADGKNVIIKGTAGAFEDVESLKNSLSSEFKNPRVTDSGATADKKIRFTIIMQEKLS